MTRASTVILCVFLFLGYSGLRILNFTAVDGVREFPDSKSYVRKASWGLWSWGDRLGPLGGISTWVLNGRPLTVPLFYKLVGNVPHKNTMLQLFLSILAWGLLGGLVVRTVDTNLVKPVAFLIILLFSLSDQIIMWDKFLLSDSIALSLLALFIASWLWLLEEWRWQKAVLVIAIAFLWTFSRDTNAWVTLMIAVVLVVIGSLWRSRRYLFIGVIFVAIFIVNEISQDYAKRWVMPFANVVGKRILPDPQKVAYFAREGLPVTPAVMRFRGQLAWSRNQAFYNDPELHDLREWVYARGKAAYMAFMLAHPVMTLLDPFRDMETLVTPRLEYFRATGFLPILSGVPAKIIYLDNWQALLLATFVLMLGVPLVAVNQNRRKTWLVAVLLVALAYPHLIVAWHGDANGVGRHALAASVHLRLGLWFLLILFADLLFGRMNRRNHHRPLAGSPVND